MKTEVKTEISCERKKVQWRHWKGRWVKLLSGFRHHFRLKIGFGFMMTNELLSRIGGGENCRVWVRGYYALTNCLFFFIDAPSLFQRILQPPAQIFFQRHFHRVNRFLFFFISLSYLYLYFILIFVSMFFFVDSDSLYTICSLHCFVNVHTHTHTLLGWTIGLALLGHFAQIRWADCFVGVARDKGQPLTNPICMLWIVIRGVHVVWRVILMLHFTLFCWNDLRMKVRETTTAAAGGSTRHRCHRLLRSWTMSADVGCLIISQKSLLDWKMESFQRLENFS